MQESHDIWVVRAGGAGDMHHRDERLRVSSDRMAQELSQLAFEISRILDRVPQSSTGFLLREVGVDVTFDGEIGFALVGSTGAARTMTLTFVRTPPT